MKICLFIFYSGIFSKQEYVAGGNAVTNPACKSIALKDWQVPTVKHYLVQMILLATWKCNYPTVLYWPNLITAMIITVGLWQIHISTSITLSSESFWVTQNILKDKIHHSNFRGSSVWQSGIPVHGSFVPSTIKVKGAHHYCNRDDRFRWVGQSWVRQCEEFGLSFAL